MYRGGGKYSGYTRLTYQAECGQLLGWWLLEQSAEETAVGCCGYSVLCVVSISVCSLLWT